MAAKKKKQELPGFDGKTARSCLKCGVNIRTKRVNYCKTCFDQLNIEWRGAEKALSLGEDFYERTDD